MRWITYISNVKHWLLQPSVSMLGLFMMTFFAAIIVLFFIHRHDATKLKWRQALVISLIACILLSLFWMQGNKGGQSNAGGETASTPPPQIPVVTTDNDSGCIHVNLIWDVQNNGDFSLKFQKQGEHEITLLKKIHANRNQTDTFWKTFEMSLYEIMLQHPSGSFLFTLEGVQSAQITEDVRKYLEKIYEGRLNGMDVVFMIGEKH